MGLDIILKVVKNGSTIATENALSREFACTLENIYRIYLVEDLLKLKSQNANSIFVDSDGSNAYKGYSPELIQLFEYFKINYIALLESIEWNWLSNNHNGLIPQKINNFNPQSTKNLYCIFQELKEDITKNPESRVSIEYTLDYLDNYFKRKIERFDLNLKPIPSPYLEKDLDLILNCLEKYIVDSEYKVCFNFF